MDCDVGDGFRVVMWCHQVDRIRNDISGGRFTSGNVVSMGDCNNTTKNRGDGVVSLTRIICCCCGGNRYIHRNDSDGEECRRCCCCCCWNTGAYAVMTIDVDMILINIIIMNIMMVVFIF